MTPTEFRARAEALGAGDNAIAQVVRAAWFEPCDHHGHLGISTERKWCQRCCAEIPNIPGDYVKALPNPLTPVAYDGTERHAAMLIGAIWWAAEEHGFWFPRRRHRGKWQVEFWTDPPRNRRESRRIAVVHDPDYLNAVLSLLESAKTTEVQGA